MKKNILFIGGFKKKLKDGSTGGQVVACRSLIQSPLSGYVNWIKLDSTMESIPPPSLAGRTLRALFRLMRFILLLAKERVDAVLIFTTSGAGFIEKGIMAIFAKRVGKRVVFSPRSGLILDDLERNGIMRRFILYVLNKCDVIMCQSESWKNIYQTETALPNQRFGVIKNWIDTTRYVNISYRARTGKSLILYLGWLETYKGVYELIDAARMVASKGYRFKVIVCGNGSQANAMKQTIAQNGLEEFFEFKGWIDLDEKVKLLSQADIFVLPSHREGFPNALLEAMAASRPVIATAVGGVPELIRHNKNGILIEPKKPEQISSAIVKMMNCESLRIRLAKAAHNDVMQHHDVNRCYHKILDILWPKSAV